MQIPGLLNSAVIYVYCWHSNIWTLESPHSRSPRPLRNKLSRPWIFG